MPVDCSGITRKSTGGKEAIFVRSTKSARHHLHLHPQGRIGSPDDITGAVLPVDGGYTAG